MDHTFLRLYPRHDFRPECPPEVLEEIAEDYKEAAAVLDVSPKASAALSRRCLQHVLRRAACVKPGNLKDEIDEVVKRGHLPTATTESLVTLKEFGNFAAHPTPDSTTGEVLPVEPGEAEFMLEILGDLFDVYFVKPARVQAQKAAMNAKRTKAGKNPLP